MSQYLLSAWSVDDFLRSFYAVAHEVQESETTMIWSRLSVTNTKTCNYIYVSYVTSHLYLQFILGIMTKMMSIFTVQFIMYNKYNYTN